MRVLDRIMLALLIVGGLNWLLVGLAQFDLVAKLFGGQDATLSRVVYTLVGISALYSLKFFKDVGRDYTAVGTTTKSNTY